MNSNNLKIDDIRKRIAEFGGELIGEYIDGKHNISVMCSCGHIRIVKLGVFTRDIDSHVCKDCSLSPRGKDHPNINKLKSEFEKDGIYIIDDSEVKWGYAKINLIDSNGYKYYSSYSGFHSNVKNGNKLRIVDISNPYSLYNICLFIKKNNKDYKYESGEYISTNAKSILLRCNKCARTWYSAWSYIRYKGKKATNENSFGNKHADILPEWDYDKNKESPYSYLEYSHKSVWWICSKCNHNWYAIIGSRTRGEGCPACAGKATTPENNLIANFPWVLDEWDFNKNSESPYSYMPYSIKKVWWICLRCGHSWISPIASRTFSGNGCPHCSLSRGAKAVKKFLIKNNIKFIPEHKFPDCINIRQLPFDFYLPDYNLCIEYDGEFHYDLPLSFRFKDKEKRRLEVIEVQKRDAIKTKYCENNNINLLRIPYWELKNIDNILGDSLF